LDHFALNRLGAAEDVESVVNTISCKWWGTKVSYSPMARPTLSRPIYIPKWRPYFIRTGIVYIRERVKYCISHLALPCVPSALFHWPTGW
jgi:hypothetical protein